MMEEAESGAAKSGAPKLDQRLVRAVARSIWKIEAREKKLEAENRTADWEQRRLDYIAQARKLVRQLKSEGVDVRMEV